MIAIENVTKIYPAKKGFPVTAVQDICLGVSRGEFVVITGRSGSGKTTLLHLVAGLTRPTSGRVLLDGTQVWMLPDAELSLLRNRKIGFVFQFPSLMPSLTVLDNVLLPTLFGPPDGRHEARERAIRLLADVGLSDKLEAYPRQLSGGQQQRVVIARSLINDPELLLADEPTSDLDEHTEQEIMTLFREIHARTGITVMLVTHSSELVSFGTRSVQMAGGRLVPEPPPAPGPE